MNVQILKRDAAQVGQMQGMQCFGRCFAGAVVVDAIQVRVNVQGK